MGQSALTPGTGHIQTFKLKKFQDITSSGRTGNQHNQGACHLPVSDEDPSPFRREDSQGSLPHPRGVLPAESEEPRSPSSTFPRCAAIHSRQNCFLHCLDVKPDRSRTTACLQGKSGKRYQGNGRCLITRTVHTAATGPEERQAACLHSDLD